MGMFENWKNNNRRKNIEARAELNESVGKLRNEEAKLAVALQSYQKSLDTYAAFDPEWESHLYLTYELPLENLEHTKKLKNEELISIEPLLETIGRLAKLRPSAQSDLDAYQAQKRDLQNELTVLETKIISLRSQWQTAKSERQK